MDFLLKEEPLHTVEVQADFHERAQMSPRFWESNLLNKYRPLHGLTRWQDHKLHVHEHAHTSTNDYRIITFGNHVSKKTT